MAQIELNSRTVAVTESKIGTALGEIDEGSLFYGSPWSNGVSK